MSKKKGRKRLSFAKIFCLCIILTCAFVLASCEINITSPGADHECAFGGERVANDSEFNNFKSTIENSASSMQNKKFYFFYLAKEINLSQKIEIPEGTFVGICVTKYNIKINGKVVSDDELFTIKGENTGSASGGIFTFKCGLHALHGREKYQYVDQTVIDMLALSGGNLCNVFTSAGEACNISLRTDLDLKSGYSSFTIPAGRTLRVCTNGYNFTYSENIESAGGRLIVFNCLDSHYHDCLRLDDEATFVEQRNLEQFYGQIQAARSGDEIHAYLYSDLYWVDELVIPTGVSVTICLNGYKAEGPIKQGTYEETVVNELTGESETVTKQCGELYAFDCSNHICTGVCEDGSALALNNNSIDLTIDFLRNSVADYGSLTTAFCVLEDDVEIPAIEGVVLGVCLNGFKSENRENQWITKIVDGEEVLTGGVVYYNCASSHMCEIANMFGQPNSSIFMDTADGVNLFIQQFGIFEEMGSENNKIRVACFSLMSDLKGEGEIVVPVGSVAVICLNGFSMGDVTIAAGSNVFVYQCEKEYCAMAEDDVLALNKDLIDLLTVYSMMSGASYSIQSDSIFTLSEDIAIPGGMLEISSGVTLNFCTHGHSVTGIEGISGVATHDDCTFRKTPHLCAIAEWLEQDSAPLNSNSSSTVNSVLSNLEQGIYLYHLTEDLVGGGVITAPANTVVGICLDGFSMDGVTVSGDNVFIYECGKHYCYSAKSNIPSIDQGAFDFLKFCLGDDPFYLNENTFIGIKGDVEVPFEIIVSDGCTLDICACGNTVTTSSAARYTNVTMHNDCLPLQDKNLDCAVCSRTGAMPLNFTCLREKIMDSDGNVILPAGDHYFYLENDFQLTRMLNIPEGVNLHICLHGYDLYSAYIWNDLRTFGCGYPECEATGVAAVQRGASFNIYDCSENMTGSMSAKFLRLSTNSMFGGLITNVSNNTVITDQSQIVGEFFSYIAINYGTVNLYGGNLASPIGFINQDGGVINLYNGYVDTMFAGIVNANLPDLSEASNSYIYIGEGATVTSALMGAVYAYGGSIVLDGGTINASQNAITAISQTIPEEGEKTPVSVVLNGGEINIGSSYRIRSSLLSSCLQSFGYAFGIANSSLDLNRTEYVGVIVSHELIINGDVDIVMGDMTNNDDGDTEKKVADLVIEGDSDIVGITKISASKDVKNEYNLIFSSTDSSLNIGKNDVFVPVGNYSKAETPNGEIVILPISPDDFKEYAGVTDMSVSPEGDIKLNIYTEIDPAFVVSGRVKFYVAYGDRVIEYAIDETVTPVNVNGVNKYVFSIATAAKDYDTDVKCYFMLDPLDGEENDPYFFYVGICMDPEDISIAKYLDTLIANENADFDESTVELAKAMKNYCAAAAYHFGAADSYTVVDGMQEMMDLVTKESLDELQASDSSIKFQASREGDYAISPVIFKTATVVLESTTSIRIYFNLADGFDITSADTIGNVTVNGMSISELGGVVTLSDTNNASRRYCLEISGIYAKDYFNRYTITFETQVGEEDPIVWSMEYSVASYIYSVVANDSIYADDVVDVVKAMAIYGATAIDYFNNAQ